MERWSVKQVSASGFAGAVMTQRTFGPEKRDGKWYFYAYLEGQQREWGPYSSEDFAKGAMAAIERRLAAEADGGRGDDDKQKPAEFDERHLVKAFAKKHGVTAAEARRAIGELGPAQAEAAAAASVLDGYLEGRLSAAELLKGRPRPKPRARSSNTWSASLRG
jgi:hypothetical protein